MSPYARHTVEALHCACLRCGYEWWSFTLPKSCAGCKSKLWDTERTRKPKRDKRAMRNARYRATLKRKAREAKRAARLAADTRE